MVCLSRRCVNKNQIDDRHSEIHVDGYVGDEGVHVVDMMLSQNQFNSQYFVEHIMVLLIQGIFPHGRNRSALRLRVHVDNHRIHISKVTEQFFGANDILRILLPPYSPDLALSDFRLFGRIKSAFAGPISMNQSNFWTGFHNF
jgi:hypothetical protein